MTYQYKRNQLIDSLLDITDNKQQTIEMTLDQQSIADIQPHGNPPHPSSPLPSLPNEILTLILCHFDQHQQSLYQCSIVSKQFYLVANPILWKKIRLDDRGTRRFLASITYASSRQRLDLLGHHIEDLDLNNAFWTDNLLLCLLPHIPQLKHLTLDNTSGVTDTSFRRLPSYCKQLTSLALSTSVLTQISFYAIGQYCRQLCHLNLHLSDRQPSAWLALLTQCPLESLEFLTPHLIDDPQTTMVIQSFDLLTHLQISHGGMDTRTSGSLFLRLPNLWPRLTTFFLTNVDTMDESALIQFIKSHPALASLDLQGNFPTSDATLDTMVLCLEHLVALTLFSKTTSTISLDGVLRLIHAFPHLHTFEIWNCSKLLFDRFPKNVHYGPFKTLRLNKDRIHQIRQGNNNNFCG